MRLGRCRRRVGSPRPASGSGHIPLRRCSPRSRCLSRTDAGAFLGSWRLMAIDGFEWDAPDTKQNAAVFGYAGSGGNRSAFPKARVVTISECASHAMVEAEIGPISGEGTGEQSLAGRLYPRLEEDWLLIADRNFYSYAGWRDAARTGAQLLWRMKSDLTLAALDLLPDGSYRSVLVNPDIRGKARTALTEAARAGQDLDPGQAMMVRVVEYQVPDRIGDGKGELICLITTTGDHAAAPAALLAEAYHQRWGAT
jgi:hypothetical protein